MFAVFYLLAVRSSCTLASGTGQLARRYTGESNAGGYGLSTEAAGRIGGQVSRDSEYRDLTPEDLYIGESNILGHGGRGDRHTSFALALGSIADHFVAEDLLVYLVKTGHGGSRNPRWPIDQHVLHVVS